MRALILAALLLTASLAGCLGQDAPQGSPEDDGDDEVPTQPDEDDEGVSAASLAPGLAWTYNVDGAYAATDTITLVVALAGVDGYLFAANDPDHLTASIAQDHPWHGWQTQDLNPQDDPDAPLFDFPLHDGKTWAYRNATATAHATTLQTPFGPLDGFEITTDEEYLERTWTYAPSVGYLLSYTETKDDTLLVSLETGGLDTADTATWYDSHAEARLVEPGESTTVTVPANATSVILAGGGEPGAQATILPPLASTQGPWVATAQDEPRMDHETRDAIQGEWTILTSAPPETSVHASLTAIETIEIEPRYGSNL